MPMYNRNTDEENQRLIDAYTAKNGSQPSDYSMPDTLDVMPGDQEYSTATPGHMAPDVETMPEDAQWGSAADSSAQYDDMVTPYTGKSGEVWPVPQLAPKGEFDKMPKGRDFRDMPTGRDVETERRSLVRQALEQKFGQVSSSAGVDEARDRAGTINNMADIGHGLDRMFTAHSAARGGQGVDNAFWSGMKQDAQRGVDNAQDERRAQITAYLEKQNLGRQGVNDVYDLKAKEEAGRLQDPNSPESMAYKAAFANMFKDYANIPGFDQMSGASIERITKSMLQPKEQMELRKSMQEQNARYQQGMLSTKQGTAPSEKERAETELIRKRTEALGSNGAKPSSPLQDAQAKYWNAKANDLETNGSGSRSSGASNNDALDVLGLGQARTKQEAIALRKNIETTNNVLASIDRIKEIRAKGKVIPFTPRAAQIDTEIQFVMGQLRLPLQGPGAMTDSDRAQLRDTIGNAAGLFAIDENTNARLDTVKSKLSRDLESAKRTNIVGYSSPEEAGTSEEKNIQRQPLVTPQMETKPGYVWMEDPENGEVGQVPKAKVDYYTKKGLRLK